MAEKGVEEQVLAMERLPISCCLLYLFCLNALMTYLNIHTYSTTLI